MLYSYIYKCFAVDPPGRGTTRISANLNIVQILDDTWTQTTFMNACTAPNLSPDLLSLDHPGCIWQHA